MPFVVPPLASKPYVWAASARKQTMDRDSSPNRALGRRRRTVEFGKDIGGGLRRRVHEQPPGHAPHGGRDGEAAGLKPGVAHQQNVVAATVGKPVPSVTVARAVQPRRLVIESVPVRLGSQQADKAVDIAIPIRRPAVHSVPAHVGQAARRKRLAGKKIDPAEGRFGLSESNETLVRTRNAGRFLPVSNRTRRPHCPGNTDCYSLAGCGGNCRRKQASERLGSRGAWPGSSSICRARIWAMSRFQVGPSHP